MPRSASSRGARRPPRRCDVNLPSEFASGTVNAYIHGGVDGNLLLRVPELLLCVSTGIILLRNVLLRRVGERGIGM